MAFRLGGWFHVQPRGWVFGSRSVADSLAASVRSRVLPGTVLRMESRLLEDGGGAALRTARWTAPDTLPDWADEADWAVPWVEHVHRLASLAADGDGGVRERAVSGRLLEVVTGDPEAAARLVARGGAALGSPSTRPAVFELLFSSGRAACTSPPDGPLPPADGVLLRCSDGRWDVRPLEGSDS
jgi:hypothetical protein